MELIYMISVEVFTDAAKQTRQVRAVKTISHDREKTIGLMDYYSYG